MYNYFTTDKDGKVSSKGIMPYMTNGDFVRGILNYYNITGTVITIASPSDGTSNLVVVDPTCTATLINGFIDDAGGYDGRLIYTGTDLRYVNVNVSISVSTTSADDIVVAIALNGTAEVYTVATTALSTKTTLTLSHMVEITENDYIEVLVGNITETANITVHALSIAVNG